jgi:hypothetical protein
MKTFTDNQGEIWNLTLSLAKIRKMRESLGLDILNPTHYLQIMSSLTDRLAFAYLLCEEQAKRIEVSIDQFEERLYGDGFANKASLAFLGETELFFQKLGQAAMASLAKRTIESMKAGQTRLDEMIASGQFDSLLNQAESEMASLLQPSDGAGSPN